MNPSRHGQEKVHQNPNLTEEEITALLGCIHLALQRIMETEDRAFTELFKHQSMNGMQTAQAKLMEVLGLPPVQNMSVTVDPNTGDTQTVVYDETTPETRRY